MAGVSGANRFPDADRPFRGGSPLAESVIRLGSDDPGPVRHGGASPRRRFAGPVYVLTLISFQFYLLLGFYLLVFAELRRRRRILNATRQ